MAVVKKFLNKENVVESMVDGLLAANPRLARLSHPFGVVFRADIDEVKQRQVTLISGGGSGHEPAHAGFIGEGMLSGAAVGQVFASPSVETVLNAIRVCCGPHGLLVIVKCYTGDRTAFGNAVEQARLEGLKVRMIVVSDDVALDPEKGITGARGIAGTVLVHKVAGAAAARGDSLEEVERVAVEAASRMGTLGVALTTCTLPNSRGGSSRLAGATVEVGLGIHGEPGRDTVPFPGDTAADELADVMVDGVLARRPAATTSPVALLVNGLGATSLMELYVLLDRALASLRARQINVVRAYVGDFMTSLDMAGVSLTLLPLEDQGGELLPLLDAATDVAAFPASTPLQQSINVRAAPPAPPRAELSCSVAVPPQTREVLTAISAALVALEPQLTEWDGVCGDGDCGHTVRRGALWVQENMDRLCESPHAAALFSTLADGVSTSMGGSLGALLEVGLRRSAALLSSSSPPPSPLSAAVAAAVAAVGEYGGAREGYRTMLDALVPAAAALERGRGVQAAARAAAEGAERTRAMEALAGRSNYVEKQLMEGTPDPGAMAAAEAFKAAAAVLQG